MSIRATLTCDLSGCGVTFGINVAGDTLFDASVPVQAAVSSTPCGDHGACDRQSGNASRVVNAFHLSAPAVRSVTAGSWVGAVTHGSSVNCDNVSFCIHGSGTHAECVGHITVRLTSILCGVLLSPLLHVLASHVPPYPCVARRPDNQFLRAAPAAGARTPPHSRATPAGICGAPHSHATAHRHVRGRNSAASIPLRSPGRYGRRRLFTPRRPGDGSHARCHCPRARRPRGT
jgi:hypothetical protein